MSRFILVALILFIIGCENQNYKNRKFISHNLAVQECNQYVGKEIHSISASNSNNYIVISFKDGTCLEFCGRYIKVIINKDKSILPEVEPQ